MTTGTPVLWLVCSMASCCCMTDHHLPREHGNVLLLRRRCARASDGEAGRQLGRHGRERRH
eukprot:11202345-Alexandrium_andersonii.AAC.1